MSVDEKIRFLARVLWWMLRRERQLAARGDLDDSHAAALQTLEQIKNGGI